jgi:serine/threonine protein kinase
MLVIWLTGDLLFSLYLDKYIDIILYIYSNKSTTHIYIYLSIYIGICVRDIKPENIMLTRSLQVKITDFGLSQDFSQAATQSQRGGFVTDTKGTWPFWAPEMCSDEDVVKYSSYASDVWAAGIVLYSILFLRLPFWDYDMDELFQKILSSSQSLNLDNPACSSEQGLELLKHLLNPVASERPSFADCLAMPWLLARPGEGLSILTDPVDSNVPNQEELLSALTPGRALTGADHEANDGQDQDNNNEEEGGEDEEELIALWPDDNSSHRESDHLMELMGHHWTPKYLNKPTSCGICKKFVWGMTKAQQRASKCSGCRITAHQDCCLSYTIECTNHNPPTSSKPPVSLKSALLTTRAFSIFSIPSQNQPFEGEGIPHSQSRETDVTTIPQPQLSTRSFLPELMSQTSADSTNSDTTLINPEVLHMGHVWRPTYLKKPTNCDICGKFIWGVIKAQQDAFKCSACRMKVHHACWESYMIECSGDARK